jgi:hypothetical protein
MAMAVAALAACTRTGDTAMIRPLRTLHKRMFYVIAVVTPTIFLVGLTQRDTQFAAPSNAPLTLRGGAEVWPSGVLATSIDQQTVTIHVLQPSRVPDPLLYYVQSSVQTAKLPANAVLLGSVHGSDRLTLPFKKGSLILYSLGHRTVVDHLAFEEKP